MTTEERLPDGDPPYDPHKHAEGLRMYATSWRHLAEFYRVDRPELADLYNRIANLDDARAQALEAEALASPVDTRETF